MKNLDLNAYGVQEMNGAEMRHTDGGWWQFVVTYILIEALMNPQAHTDSFMDGYNAVY